MPESAKAFFKAILHRWWWLVTGIVGGGFCIVSLIGITPTIRWTAGLSVFLVCLLIASFLAYRELFNSMKPAQRNGFPVMPRGKRRLSWSHQMALIEVVTQMESVHGHSDQYGLEADVMDGVLVSDLINRNCSRCNKPRNQRGDYV